MISTSQISEQFVCSWPIVLFPECEGLVIYHWTIIDIWDPESNSSICHLMAITSPLWFFSLFFFFFVLFFLRESVYMHRARREGMGWGCVEWREGYRGQEGISSQLHAEHRATHRA